MASLDSCFCYSAFVVFFSSMGLLFREVFALLFDESDILQNTYKCVAGAMYLCFSILIIMSASEAVHLASVARDRILSLPGKCPARYKEIKFLVKRKLNIETRLTLWKMYAIERSLLASSLGILLTYGILFRSLYQEYTNTINVT
ncbi:hypothetical protein JTE90_027659 [Oedothorax gibbosus]|uniref:Gustatory receptor n=1 Tax=Oedothorax gibbosus TaxID=931172 RepID=A0AAV6UPH1_9ARAC|nr:hypothetical protein JTE90_027659 [Oedothorax gibbosus]